MAARSALKRFWRNQSGATAIEYSMIGGLIFVVIVTSVSVFGGKTGNIMDKTATAVSDAIP